MKMTSVLEFFGQKRSKKLDALKSVKKKLDKKQRKLGRDIKSEKSKKKRKKLETKLATCRKQRDKAKKLIKEFA